HPGPTGVVTGLVQSQLGANGKPIFNASPGSGGITALGDWYSDVPGVNLKTSHPLTLNETSQGSGLYQFKSNSFFPIDNLPFDNSEKDDKGVSHNLLFTLELHTRFTYRSGDTFDFAADDDLWVFINGRLVIDLGGLHPVASASVALNSLNLMPGQDYSFDLFYAEPHTAHAALTMTISRGPVAGYHVAQMPSPINGVPFPLQVQPVDQFGNPFPTNPGVVTFTSTDPNATLPASFNFSTATPDANGFYTIPGFVLNTPGPQTIAI